MFNNSSQPNKRNAKDILAGLEGTPARECQNPTGEQPPEPWEPFRGSSRPRDKTRLVKWLVFHPDGVPLARCVRAILPEDPSGSISDRDYHNTDYKFAQRFYQRTEYADITDKGGSKWVSPTPECFNLTQASKFPIGAQPDYAKDRSRALLRNIWSLNDVKNCKILARDFVTYLDSIDDKRLMLEERGGPDKLTLPYHTRFNNDHRKKEQWARYNQAWEAADARYEEAQFLTLTTDPKRYSSLLEMVDGLMSAWQNLHECLNQRFGDGRLDFLRVLEFGGSSKSSHVGLPHLHVVVYGVPYLDESWLSGYWADHHAEIVDRQNMYARGENSWVMPTDDGSGMKSAAGYLGKYLSKTFESISKDPSDLNEEIESWSDDGNWKNSELWKLACYWASGRQFWDCSHDLKQDDNPDKLQDIPGLGETKYNRLKQAGIQTLSDVRLSDLEDISAIEGISQSLAEKINRLAGTPSKFDVKQYDFVGAASPSTMPSQWSLEAHHLTKSDTAKT